MAIDLNLQGNCTVGTRGTGLGDCLAKEGDATGFDISVKSWKLDTTTDTLPTEAEYKALVQAETIYPFNGLYNFDQVTPDSEYATGSTGLKSKIRSGKPEYAFTFDKGYCAHKGMYDKEGKDRWNISLKFETGVFLATDVSESIIKGFSNGLFDVGTYKFQQGTDPSMSVVSFQFSNAVELNQRGVFYTWDELGYDMNFVDGIINASVSFETTPVAGTELRVEVKDDCNRSANIQGLTNANNWVVGGIQATPATVTAVTYSDNVYVLTLDNATISTDTISVNLGDVTNGYNSAENASGDLYKGSTSTETIA